MVAPFGDGAQLRSDPGGDGPGRCECMSPDAENSPALAAKQPGCATVTGSVTGDFVLPVFAVSPGHAAVPSAAMPEAAVHEDGEAGAAENEIRMAGNGLVPPPAGDAGCAKNGRQFQLGGFVAFRADGGHDLRSLFLCEYVGHGDSVAGS